MPARPRHGPIHRQLHARCEHGDPDARGLDLHHAGRRSGDLPGDRRPGRNRNIIGTGGSAKIWSDGGDNVYGFARQRCGHGREFNSRGGNDDTLDAAEFHVGNAAAAADDRIIYDAATGSLYFDADGTGATAAVWFAALGTGLNVTENNFLLV